MNSRLKAVHYWNVTTGAEIQKAPLGSVWGHRITFFADGKKLLAWPSDGTIRCWDVAAGREVRRLDNPRPGWMSVATLSPDGRTARSRASTAMRSMRILAASGF